METTTGWRGTERRGTESVRSASSWGFMIRLWAALGLLSLIVVAVGWTRWVLSGPSAAPVGPDEFTSWKLVLIKVFEWSTFALVPFFLWRFLIRPTWRARSLTFDGMLMIALITLWFYDPLDNYFNLSFAYNAHFIQLGTWAPFIPGYKYVSGYPEPLLLAGGMYVWLCFSFSLVGCAFLRRLQAWRPNMSKAGLIASSVTGCAAIVFVVETVFIRTEIWGYPGASRFLTLWPGTRYQYPLLNPILAGLVFTVLVALRYFKDDHGRSFAERGVESLPISSRLRKTVSLLAIVGCTHVGFLVGYYMPYSWTIALRADTLPALPSYMRAGMCGAGTDYACPSRYVPIPHGDSIHLRPDDPRLPPEVRTKQGLGE